VISKEEPPYVFKLHIQAKKGDDLTQQIITDSIKKVFVLAVGHDRIKDIDIRFFNKKDQFKVFLEIGNAIS
jgi:hypothetical protein